MFRGLIYMMGLITLLIVVAIAAVAFRVDKWPWKSYAEDGRQYLVDKLEDAEFTEVTGDGRGGSAPANYDQNDSGYENDSEWENRPAEPMRTVFRYTVRRGDTLYRIAKDYYGVAEKWRLIARANGIRKPSDLRVGKVIMIPSESYEQREPERSWRLEPMLALTPAYTLEQEKETSP